MEFIMEMMADFIGEIASLQLYKIAGSFKSKFKRNMGKGQDDITTYSR